MSKDLELNKLIKEIKPQNKAVDKKEDNEDIFKFSKNDIVKGIILSEILGPPKGRRK